MYYLSEEYQYFVNYGVECIRMYVLHYSGRLIGYKYRIDLGGDLAIASGPAESEVLRGPKKAVV